MEHGGKELIDRIAAEVKGDAAGAIGIAVVIVRPDGDIRTLYAWGDGGKFPVLAGLSLLTHDLCTTNTIMGGKGQEPRPRVTQ